MESREEDTEWWWHWLCCCDGRVHHTGHSDVPPKCVTAPHPMSLDIGVVYTALVSCGSATLPQAVKKIKHVVQHEGLQYDAQDFLQHVDSDGHLPLVTVRRG